MCNTFADHLVINGFSTGIGWRAQVHPKTHPVSEYEFDVIIGGDGRRNTLEGNCCDCRWPCTISSSIPNLAYSRDISPHQSQFIQPLVNDRACIQHIWMAPDWEECSDLCSSLFLPNVLLAVPPEGMSFNLIYWK